MRIHERTLIVQKASIEFGSALGAIIEKHDLTFGEIFAILSDEMRTWAKYAIRGERHPEDPEKRGDET